MKLFLSWSGDRGREFANAVRDWIKFVLGDEQIVFFQSDDDIGPGQRWTNKLKTSLDEADLCLLCLTSESLYSQWVGFEAGWLHRRLEDGTIIPLLLDVNPEEVTGPLALLQSKRTDAKSMLDVIRAINEKLASPEADHLLERRAQTGYADLQRELEPIVRWGKQGVVATYTRIGEEPTLKALYETAENIVKYSSMSIKVLTSGLFDSRQSDPQDIEAHLHYTDFLMSYLSEHPEISYRELVQFDINYQEPFHSNAAWLSHMRSVAQLSNQRRNVNLRSMPNSRSDSLTIVDTHYLLLESSEVFGGRRVLGVMSLRDSEGVVPRGFAADFDEYWDRGSREVDYQQLLNLPVVR